MRVAEMLEDLTNENDISFGRLSSTALTTLNSTTETCADFVRR